jgi:hypothetical protein
LLGSGGKGVDKNGADVDWAAVDEVDGFLNESEDEDVDDYEGASDSSLPGDDVNSLDRRAEEAAEEGELETVSDDEVDDEEDFLARDLADGGEFFSTLRYPVNCTEQLSLESE